MSRILGYSQKNLLLVLYIHFSLIRFIARLHSHLIPHADVIDQEEQRLFNDVPFDDEVIQKHEEFDRDQVEKKILVVMSICINMCIYYYI